MLSEIPSVCKNMVKTYSVAFQKHAPGKLGMIRKNMQKPKNHQNSDFGFETLVKTNYTSNK